MNIVSKITKNFWQFLIIETQMSGIKPPPHLSKLSGVLI